MTRILEIPDKFLDGVRKDNPFGLVLKGAAPPFLSIICRGTGNRRTWTSTRPRN